MNIIFSSATFLLTTVSLQGTVSSLFCVNLWSWIWSPLRGVTWYSEKKRKGAQRAENGNASWLRGKHRLNQNTARTHIFSVNLTKYAPNSVNLRKYWKNSAKEAVDAPSMKALNWDYISKKRFVWGWREISWLVLLRRISVHEMMTKVSFSHGSFLPFSNTMDLRQDREIVLNFTDDTKIQDA